jgi:hypothetical protein
MIHYVVDIGFEIFAFTIPSPTRSLGAQIENSLPYLLNAAKLQAGDPHPEAAPTRTAS